MVSGEARQSVPWWKTDLGENEIQRISEAIRQRHINHGPVSAELEQRLAECLQVPHVAMTSSGSSALLVSLLACGVGPGDEVIVPAVTFVATAHAVLLTGARVKLVDVQAYAPVMDVGQLASALTAQTRAIVPVHLGGVACAMSAIGDFAAQHKLKVIEDAAQAFTSRCETGCLGTLSDAGAFSMSLTKLIPTGEGGFIATHSGETFEHILKLRNQGAHRIADNAFDEFGFNLRFNDILASIGAAQLDRLEDKRAALCRIYRYYRDELADLPFLRMINVDMDRGELPLWSQVVCTERDDVIERLQQQGIQARPFHPCLADSKHLQQPGDFPAARFYARHALTLPSGPDQTDDNLQRTVRALREMANHIHTSIDSLEVA